MEDKFISTELNYHEEFSRLATAIIKHTEKYTQKASDEALKNVYDEYR